MPETVDLGDSSERYGAGTVHVGVLRESRCREWLCAQGAHPFIKALDAPPSTISALDNRLLQTIRPATRSLTGFYPQSQVNICFKHLDLYYAFQPPLILCE